MTTTGYLLDTNVLSHLAGGGQPGQVNAVRSRLEQLPATSPIFISVISWGEIEYGWRSGSPEMLRDNDRRLFQQFSTVAVNRHIAQEYAEIKACLFEKFAPRGKRGKKHRTEQLRDPMSGYALGVQENDLWIVAQAIERNLVLVTSDRMAKIRSLSKVVDNLQFEDWTT